MNGHLDAPAQKFVEDSTKIRNLTSYLFLFPLFAFVAVLCFTHGSNENPITIVGTELVGGTINDAIWHPLYS